MLENYNWADSYIIREEDCTVDGIKVRFPKCILFFREGFESDMSLYLGNPLSDEVKFWSSFELINSVFAQKKKNNKPQYLDNSFPFASKEKVKLGLTNLCIATQYYLKSCISGDFSWVGDIQKNKSNRR